MSLKDRMRKSVHNDIIDTVDSNINVDSDITNIINIRHKKYVELRTKVAVYLENEVAEQLDELCTEKGMKSNIVNEVLKDFLKKIKSRAD